MMTLTIVFSGHRLLLWYFMMGLECTSSLSRAYIIPKELRKSGRVNAVLFSLRNFGFEMQSEVSKSGPHCVTYDSYLLKCTQLVFGFDPVRAVSKLKMRVCSWLWA